MGGVGKFRGMGIDKLGGNLGDIDHQRQVRKAKVQPTDESIIDGVTHDSIKEFVDASKARRHLPRHQPTFAERVRRFFGR